MGKRTPWGISDHEKTYAPGIVFYGTPSHGGFHLDARRNARVHEAWRKKGGWYEEDCDWGIVVLTHWEHFDAAERESAASTAKNWHPDAYTAVTGTPVSLEESSVLRERAFRAAHAADWVCVSAAGDWHKDVPTGFVGVTACVGGRDARGCYAGPLKTFLVPADEYRSGRGSFVVDPARHTPLGRESTV